MREYLKRSRQLSNSCENGASSPALSCPITRIGSFRQSEIANSRSAIFQKVLNESCEKRWVPSSGNGSVDVLIDCCVPTRTCTANGFTFRTILYSMAWSKERKIGRII